MEEEMACVYRLSVGPFVDFLVPLVDLLALTYYKCCYCNVIRELQIGIGQPWLLMM